MTGAVSATLRSAPKRRFGGHDLPSDGRSVLPIAER